MILPSAKLRVRRQARAFCLKTYKHRGRLTHETTGVVTEDGSMEEKLTSSPNYNRGLTSATVDSIVAEGKVDVKEILESFIFFF
jgi:hypothetical protein